MSKECEQMNELGKEGLLQLTRRASTLDETRFSLFLSFLDELEESQGTPPPCPHSQS